MAPSVKEQAEVAAQYTGACHNMQVGAHLSQPHDTTGVFEGHGQPLAEHQVGHKGWQLLICGKHIPHLRMFQQSLNPPTIVSCARDLHINVYANASITRVTG